uniref:hypothetical protein n=1 Tax=uncultured Caulobacter sp. TaxID=158749 RepID=UPI0025F12A75|nr:hypothetical protein [uncultured Caulobacter sp.]
MTARIVLTIPGAYAVTAACTMLLARTIPASRLDATLWATIAAFGIYAALVVWVFAASSALRAGLVLLAIGAIAGLGAMWAA